MKPMEQERADLGRTYEEALARAATLVPFGTEAARIYATIRRGRTIRGPDAIQLACAAHARVDLFITNDDRLSQQAISGIQFITSLERAFV